MIFMLLVLLHHLCLFLRFLVLFVLHLLLFTLLLSHSATTINLSAMTFLKIMDLLVLQILPFFSVLFCMFPAFSPFLLWWCIVLALFNTPHYWFSLICLLLSVHSHISFRASCIEHFFLVLFISSVYFNRVRSVYICVYVCMRVSVCVLARLFVECLQTACFSYLSFFSFDFSMHAFPNNKNRMLNEKAAFTYLKFQCRSCFSSLLSFEKIFKPNNSKETMKKTNKANKNRKRKQRAMEVEKREKIENQPNKPIPSFLNTAWSSPWHSTSFGKRRSTKTGGQNSKILKITLCKEQST